MSKKYPDAVLTCEPETWLSGSERSQSGRLLSLQLGGVAITGAQLRSLFSLRSTALDISTTDTGFLFDVTGYGHGVGMSQYGAQRLALAGSGYEEILEWYYSGVEFSNMLSFFE